MPLQWHLPRLRVRLVRELEGKMTKKLCEELQAENERLKKQLDADEWEIAGLHDANKGLADENKKLHEQLDAAVEDIHRILTDNAEESFPLPLCRYCGENDSCGAGCNPQWRGEAGKS